MNANEFKGLLGVLQYLHQNGCWDDIALRFTAFNVKTETGVLGRCIHDQLGIITRFVAGRQGALAPV